MAKGKRTGRKASATSGLQMAGGAAAGAAAGSLIGPVGAAVGAVVGGIAGANASEIAESKPMKKLTSATKITVNKALKGKSAKKTLTKARSAGRLTKNARPSSPAKKKRAVNAAKTKKNRTARA